MKVCITAAGPTLTDAVDPSFGRAAYFLVYDLDNGDLRAVPNDPGAHGAGVQSAQTVVENGAKAVITGSVGPNAYQGLSTAGIEIYTGAAGTVQDAISAYKSGQLTRVDTPTGRGHGR